MDFTFDIALKTRAIFFNMLENYTLDQLNKKPEGFNNTIFWNIKHIVVTQQLLTYGLSNLPLLVTESETEDYRKGTKSKMDASKEDIELLKKQLFSTIEQTQKDYRNGVFKTFNSYTVSTKSTLTTIKEALQFNNFHEGIHLGYIIALKKGL
jgi:hypothetical protein